jgi:hypothetical protein
MPDWCSVGAEVVVVKLGKYYDKRGVVTSVAKLPTTGKVRMQSNRTHTHRPRRSAAPRVAPVESPSRALRVQMGVFLYDIATHKSLFWADVSRVIPSPPATVPPATDQGEAATTTPEQQAAVWEQAPMVQ